MNLKEVKRKTLGLIEELNPNSVNMTDDPDIAAKFNDVTNQRMFELARMKKIAKYVEFPVTKGELIDFERLSKECGYEVYQISLVGGVNYVPKANSTIIKILESGTAEVDLFVYPERITDKTKDSYEFELSADALEILPYGIAGDLLMGDVSTEYGRIYAEEYKSQLQLLDPRNQMGSLYIDGGVDI